MASLSPTPKLQFFGTDGLPLVGGKLYTYAAGTTTPIATYTDNTGTNQNTNGAAQIKPTVQFRLRGSASSVSGMPFTWPMRMRRITTQSVVAF